MKDLHVCESCGYLCAEYHNHHSYEIIEDVLLCNFCAAAYHQKMTPIYYAVKETLALHKAHTLDKDAVSAIGC